MNAVEIEEAISALAEQPFDAEEFPFAFLEAFGNKETTLKRLRSGATNKSDVGGVLQTSNIHLKTCESSEVSATLDALRESLATAKGKVQYLVATDGADFEAEDLVTGETVACAYDRFPDHFGFFLSLAGISTVKEIRENAFDIKATARLNRLYVQLLRDNTDWGTAERRNDMNHFMARLIFCFFAEDTDIFSKPDLFIGTIEQMADRDGSNIHEIISELFRSMNTKFEDRDAENIARWARPFPYVNGGLFSGTLEVPKFTKIARSYLVHIGNLDWKKINPDIFGSMIQAVADDEERGELGMHYTSVPNILKVLNPLFLDELREQLEAAGDNARKLLNLRNRLATIRVFDPACGSGNFLVISYKEMRAIEAEINRRRGEADRRTVIPITNFRGIELRDFSAEIARLALIIAEYQCDVLYRGQKEAIQDFLPLRAENWITCGNALRLDWHSVCPPTGTGVKHRGDDLFVETKPQHEIDFENEGGETYICGNPPYLGGKKQTEDQKSDMLEVFGKSFPYKNLDYICSFFAKAKSTLSENCSVAFVATSSINQGTHVPTLWPYLLDGSTVISFGYRPFKWKNNAAKNAGVFVSIIGLTKTPSKKRWIFEEESKREVENISAYLLAGNNVIVDKESRPISKVARPITGNAAYDETHLRLSEQDKQLIESESLELAGIIRPASGTTEFISGKRMWCLWINDEDLERALRMPLIKSKIDKVREYRVNGGDVAKTLAKKSHQFRFRNTSRHAQILIPQVLSDARTYFPVGYLDSSLIITHLAHAMYDAEMFNFSILSSKIHFVWTLTLAGRHGNGIRYNSNLCWNTIPVPTLTEKNKSDLTRCAEEILLARENHFPATIADLYNPDNMPADLKAAHDRNDEVLERIYIGRRFKNDTERLEKLFELYTKMTAATPKKKGFKQ